MFRLLLPVALLVAMISTSVRADIIIEIQDSTVDVGTVGAILDVVISSDAADQPIAITGDFQILNNATFLDPPGTFDEAGFYGNGNFNAASSFLVDTNDPSFAFMSLDIETATPVPGSEVILAQLFVDSENLAPGTYDVELSNLFVFGSQGQIAANGVNGTLTVTAIPEPTGVLMLGAITSLAVVRRRRR
ncbi:MAG: PEP-CTERM sorting domain-containing protein [Planctomycetota bacterium]